MNLTKRLLDASADIWERYYKHPFINGIGDGSLDTGKFRYYIIQDYLYLVEYAKAFAVAITKESRPETICYLAQLIQMIISEEMNTHNSYMEQLNITREEIHATPSSIINKSYTSYMLDVAHAGSSLDAFVAILPCALSYEAIGRYIADTYPLSLKHPVFKDWVAGYSSEEYRKANKQMIAVLEEMAKDITENEAKRLEDIFVRSSRYEEMFWDMAWEMRS